MSDNMGDNMTADFINDDDYIPLDLFDDIYEESDELGDDDPKYYVQDELNEYYKDTDYL